MSLSELSSRAIIGRYYKRLNQKTGIAWVEALSNYFLPQIKQAESLQMARSSLLSCENGSAEDRQKASPLRVITIENQHFEATLEHST